MWRYKGFGEIPEILLFRRRYFKMRSRRIVAPLDLKNKEGEKVRRKMAIRAAEKKAFFAPNS